MQLTLNYCDIADVFEITPPHKRQVHLLVGISMERPIQIGTMRAFPI